MAFAPLFCTFLRSARVYIGNFSMYRFCGDKLYSLASHYTKLWKYGRNKCHPELFPRIYLPSAICAFVCAITIEKSEPMAKEEVILSNMTHPFLIKQACSGAVEAAATVLTYVTVAILDCQDEYKKGLENLLSLMDRSIVAVGNEQDDRVWQHVITARNDVETTKKKLLALETQMKCVTNLINAAAETAFSAGNDYAGITANERLLSAEQQIKWNNEKLSKMEKEVIAMQKKMIGETVDISCKDSD